MTLVLLVRHADTPVAGKVLTGWSRGVHLNERGLEQARGLVERLEPVPIAAVYSSPLERCCETAAPLARARGLEVRVRRALLEVDYGEWTNRSIRQLARTKRWQAVQRTPSSFRFPGGESLRGVQARAVDAVRAIAEEHPNDAVMIVSHADVVRLVLAELAGIHLDLYQRLAVAPASVSAVALGDGQTRVLTVNDTGSLASLAPPAPVRRRRSPKMAG
ncbi:MAG: MSMEG_4193 family putative phosphomutase [Solirubrobacterales bacterium]